MTTILISLAAMTYWTIVVLVGRGSDFHIWHIRLVPIVFTAMHVLLCYALLATFVENWAKAPGLGFIFFVFASCGLVPGLFLRYLGRCRLFR